MKAKKEAVAAARSESEKVEGSKEHRWEEREISVTIGSFLMEHGVEWMVKEGVVCDSCEKKEKKCFWRMEAGKGKACLACHDLKKSCVASRVEESETEAGPSKKRKVERKGKGKVKVATPVSRVADSVTIDVLWDILKELKGLHAEVGDLRVFAQHTTSVAESSWRTQRQIGMCVNELHCHFVPENDEESVGVGAENEGSGGVEVKRKEDGSVRW